jgi:hypothetical protein
VTRQEEVRESAAILLETLGDAQRLLDSVRPMLDQVRRWPGALGESTMCDLYAETDDLYREIHSIVSALKRQVTNSAQFGPVTTSDGSRGWKATKLGFASRMGSTYRLDPLTASELRELT